MKSVTPHHLSTRKIRITLWIRKHETPTLRRLNGSAFNHVALWRSSPGRTRTYNPAVNSRML
ncbi:MAG: hypothetical protein OXF84_05965, partial [Bacteroidetes bacterium]|nr:hypothetical protein [Bacteroidota bacterium]